MNNENPLNINVKKPFDDTNISRVFNVLVLGSKNVGKSSLIEYLSGVNIFPQDQEVYKILVKLKLKCPKKRFENESKTSEKKAEIEENTISLNNESFYSFDKFHSFLKKEGNKLKEEDQLKVSLVKEKSILSFNYTFTEISDKLLEKCDESCKNEFYLGNINLLLDDVNCIFLICLSFTMFKNEYAKYQEFVNKYDFNNNRTIYIINKCDIGNIRDDQKINEMSSLKNVVFMINRTNENRKINYNEFTNIEKEFFNSNKFKLNFGIMNLNILLEKVTKDILINNMKKTNDNPLSKMKRINHSGQFETPMHNKTNSSLLTSNSIKNNKWKESINKIIQTYYDCIIFLLERKLKKVKYNDSEEKFNTDLISQINKIINKNEYSNDLKSILIFPKHNFNNDDSIEVNRKKINNWLNDLYSKVVEETSEKIKKVFFYNYEDLNLEIRNALHEIYGRPNPEFFEESFEKIKSLSSKRYSEYEKITYLEIERELNIPYFHNENSYKLFESVFESLQKENFNTNNENVNYNLIKVKLINEYLENMVNLNLSTVVDIICKNYCYFFLMKLRDSDINFQDENLFNLPNSKSKIFKKGLSINYSKESSYISKDTPSKKYYVYETSHIKNRSINNFSNKSKSKVESNKENQQNLIESNNDSKIKIISNFEIEEKEEQDEIIMIWDTTYYITVYSFASKELKKESVNGIPNNIFMENNRFLNAPNKVFVSGGVDRNKFSDLFFVLERKSNKVKILQSVPVPITRHSLIILKDKSLILAGGKNNKSCYIYHIPLDKWEKLNNLNYEREDASLFCFNDMLYIFGGLLETKPYYLNTIIEYTYLDNRKKSYWNMMDVKFNIPEENKFDFIRLSGSGIIIPQVLKNKVLICGGYNNENSDEVNFVYEFLIYEDNNNSKLSEITKRTDLHLCIPNWFQEANFITLQNNYYNYDIDGNLHSFSINMDKFFVHEYNY